VEVTLLHNPGCSKSRAALALAETHGASVKVVDYVASPPTIAELGQLLDLLGVEPLALVRDGDALYAELGLDAAGMTRTAVLAALHAHPQLLQRPIAVANGKAVIARPPEAILDIL
jgi:arsenate reductase (glutaredoxin)